MKEIEETRQKTSSSLQTPKHKRKLNKTLEEKPKEKTKRQTIKKILSFLQTPKQKRKQNKTRHEKLKENNRKDKTKT